MRLEKIIRSFAVAALAATFLFSSLSAVDARPRKKARVAHSAPKFAAMVVDAQTGKTLYAKAPNEKRFPASVTKVMTLYMLFEALEKKKVSLDSPLKVSSFASRQAPSKAGVRAGDTVSVEEAILALVTKSANDVAVTVAENLGGSEPAFARMMTKKAHALGMKQTVYRNASGLPNPQQVTTASDLIKLSIAIQKRFPQYYPYFSTAAFDFRGQYFGNHNKLLGNVEGVDGIKTGYTRASGFNLTTSVKTNGRHIVAVVLGGRTGAQRDAAMRQLIAQYMPIAYVSKTGTTKLASLGGAEFSKNDDDEADSVVDVKVKPSPKEKVQVAAVEPTSSTKVAAPVAKVEMKLVQPVKQPAVVVAGVPTPASSPKSAKTKASDVTGSIEHRATGDVRVSEKKNDDWLIQVGALPSEKEAKKALSDAKSANANLAKAEPFTEKVSSGSAIFYRARFAGLERAEAQSICNSLKRNDLPCVIMRN